MDITIAVDDQDFNRSISDTEMGTDDEVFSPVGLEQSEVPRIEPSSSKMVGGVSAQSPPQIDLNESLSDTGSQLVEAEHVDIQDETDSNATILAEVTNVYVSNVVEDDDKIPQSEPLRQSSPKKRDEVLSRTEDSLVLNASPPRTTIDRELLTPGEVQQTSTHSWERTTHMEDLGFFLLNPSCQLLSFNFHPPSGIRLPKWKEQLRVAR